MALSHFQLIISIYVQPNKSYRKYHLIEFIFFLDVTARDCLDNAYPILIKVMLKFSRMSTTCDLLMH